MYIVSERIYLSRQRKALEPGRALPQGSPACVKRPPPLKCQNFLERLRRERVPIEDLHRGNQRPSPGLLVYQASNPKPIANFHYQERMHFMCVSALLACLSVYHTCAWNLGRLEMGIGEPETGITALM